MDRNRPSDTSEHETKYKHQVHKKDQCISHFYHCLFRFGLQQQQQKTCFTFNSLYLCDISLFLLLFSGTNFFVRLCRDFFLCHLTHNINIKLYTYRVERNGKMEQRKRALRTRSIADALKEVTNKKFFFFSLSHDLKSFWQMEKCACVHNSLYHCHCKMCIKTNSNE